MTVYEARVVDITSREIASESATEREQRREERRRSRERMLFSTKVRASQRLLGIQIGLRMVEQRSKRWIYRHAEFALVLWYIAAYFLIIWLGKYILAGLVGLFAGHVGMQLLIIAGFVVACTYVIYWVALKILQWATPKYV